MGDREVKQKNMRKAFTTLQKRANALGITSSQLGSVKSIKNLGGNPRGILFPIALVIGLIAVLSGSGFLLYQKQVVTHRGVFQFLSDYGLYFDVKEDTCLMPIPEMILDMFRPPVDCSECRNVHGVDRVSKLSAAVFSEKYAYTSQPVVVLDGTRDWTASEVFSFEYFKKIYAPDSPALKSQGEQCQFFPYKTSFESLGDVFNMSKKDASMQGKPWYIGWSNCDSVAANELRKHYTRPYFLPEDSESSRTDWIFMGSPGYGANIHIDNVQKPSWQAQIRGTKKWTLEPPPECSHVCDARHEVVVNPGEIIILDTNKWFHQTDIIGEDMSITIGSEYD